MSILIDRQTRVLVQGITGGQARVDTARCLQYGTHVVAGVTPGRGGEHVHGIPVYHTVKQAVARHAVDVSVIYVPGPGVKSAVLEALDAGVKRLLVTAEFVPLHDVVYICGTGCGSAHHRLQHEWRDCPRPMPSRWHRRRRPFRALCAGNNWRVLALRGDVCGNRPDP